MTDDDPYAEVAQWYDVEHDGVTDDLECYLELLSGKNGGRTAVLEVGSGTGRIAVALATAGYEVTGIEPSIAMRLRCQARLAELPERVARRVHIVAGTADNLGAMSHGSDASDHPQYNAVLYGLNTFAHLTDYQQRRRALDTARRHLLEDGRLLIDLDLAGPRRLLTSAGQLYVQGMWRRPESDEWITHLVSGAFGSEAGTLLVTHFYDVFRSPGEVHRTLAQMSLALLSRGELELAVLGAGFEVEAVYGSFDLTPFDDLSGRVILVAQRGPGD